MATQLLDIVLDRNVTKSRNIVIRMSLIRRILRPFRQRMHPKKRWLLRRLAVALLSDSARHCLEEMREGGY